MSSRSRCQNNNGNSCWPRRGISGRSQFLEVLIRNNSIGGFAASWKPYFGMLCEPCRNLSRVLQTSDLKVRRRAFNPDSGAMVLTVVVRDSIRKGSSESQPAAFEHCFVFLAITRNVVARFFSGSLALLASTPD